MEIFYGVAVNTGVNCVVQKIESRFFYGQMTYNLKFINESQVSIISECKCSPEAIGKSIKEYLGKTRGE